MSGGEVTNSKDNAINNTTCVEFVRSDAPKQKGDVINNTRCREFVRELRHISISVMYSIKPDIWIFQQECNVIENLICVNA